MRRDGGGVSGTGSGKRTQDRAWREFYAVLAGTSLKFYKDKKDAIFVSEEGEGVHGSLAVC